MLVGRDVVRDMWTFQIVEAYDEQYWRVFRAVDRAGPGAAVRRRPARLRGRDETAGQTVRRIVTCPAARTLPAMQDSRIRTDVPGDGLPAHFRRVVSFHPRGGRLNAVQRKAFETHADRWYLEAADLSEPVDGAALFGRNAGLVLEIGSGMGESTVAMAVNRPEVNLLAVEVYKPGVAQTLHHLSRAGVQNVRVMRGDGVQVLTDLIAPGSRWPSSGCSSPIRGRRPNTSSDGWSPPSSPPWSRPGCVAAAPSGWPPTGRRTPSGCWPRAPRPRACATPTPAGRRVPEFRPRTRFERRGLAAGHEIFDLEFIRR